jgi:hypothetical protein
MTVPKVLRVMQDGIEFFTIEGSGECAVSIRGLARMCGVTSKQIRQCLHGDGNGAKKLEALDGVDVYLGQEILKSERQIKPVSSKVATVLILHYSFLGNKNAQKSLNSFMAIGFDSYVQAVTGYLPAQYAESTLEARHQINRLIREPNPWKRLYSAEMCGKIRSWYFPRDFFWRFAYFWMTQEEIDFLNEHNPVVEGIWQRQARIFQHLSEATRDRLAPEIAALCTLVESSTGRQDFETRWHRIHGADQQELFNA